MKKEQEKIYKMLRGYFCNKIPSFSEITSEVYNFANNTNYEELTNKDFDEIIELLKINVGVKAYEPSTIKSENCDSKWFEDMKKDPLLKHDYWNRYETYLRYTKHFEDNIIATLKTSTEEILGFCANPSPFSGEIKKRKGLVVGDVQSGKTANYMALINMAADYGYKLFVVLAGLTDSLRIQTQKRVDEGFIGAASDTFGSSKIKFIGVGQKDSDYYGVTLTNIGNDFKKEFLEANNNTISAFNKPVILVIKKNKKTLENLITNLKPGTNGVKEHILIIDDESDNASVNTKNNDEDPSTINRLIRDLFNNFKIASYIGYTATPFANIFINPDNDESFKDLFPTDFITLLKTPSIYFGYEKVFGENIDGKTRYLREIEESEPDFLPVKHKKDYKYFKLCNSLKEAILVFFINNVLRTKRHGTYAHRSMMINISRFNNMQNEIRIKVADYVNFLRQIIEQTSYMCKEQFLANKEMLQMYNIFMNSEYYNDLREEFTWDEIQSGLLYEADRMKVIIVNRFKEDEKLDYDSCKDTGARYIVIGGFVLSRGLTLEGLMVSYYSRNGSAYDTLLQMCRWFGYRPMYKDLCRIYMSRINIDNFGAVIEATNDLKDQFEKMRNENKTPDNFGLMVKTCPDILNTLLITSRNKSRNAIDYVLTLNYSKNVIDTSKIYYSKEYNDINLQVFRTELEQKLGNVEIFKNRYMYRSVNKSIISNIIKKVKFPDVNTKLDSLAICNFLKTASKNFDEWDVVFATGNEESNPFDKLHFGNKEIPCGHRSFTYRKDDSFIRISGNNNKLINPQIFNSGIDDETLKIICSDCKDKKPLEKDYLLRRKKPLFVIFPIILKEPEGEYDFLEKNIKKEVGNNIIFGIAIGFPINGDGVSITYKINARRMEELAEERTNMEDDYNV